MDNVWAQCFSHCFRERSIKSRQNPRADFSKARKDLEGFKTAFFPFTVAEFCARWIFSNSRLFAYKKPFRELKKRKFGPKIEVYLWQTNLKANVCKNSTFQVNRKKATSYLEQPSRHFFQPFMWRTSQQTLLAINLASQQKTTKLYFSFQLRKQFKLLTVPFKPLRCCFRSDKLVDCCVWKFCKDPF